MPTRRGALSVETVNNTLYAIGGSNWVCGAYRTVEAYDTVSNTWTTKAQKPTPIWGHISGVIKGTIYVTGGTNSCSTPVAPVSALEAYNPATDTWTSKAPIPSARLAAMGGVINGILYVAGGADPSGASAALLAYDPANDSWTNKAPMPMAKYAAASAVVNGKLYVFGGIDGSGYATSVYAYNPVNDSWTTHAAVPTPTSSGAAGTIAGMVYVFGGDRSVANIYDPVTDSWNSAPPMPTVRNSFGVGVVNGVLYAVGGADANYAVYNTAESFTPASTCSQDPQLQTLLEQISTLTTQNIALSNQLALSEAVNSTLTAQNTALSNQLAQIQAVNSTLTTQNMSLSNQIAPSQTIMTTLSSGLGTIANNPGFQIPGTTLTQQIQALSTAIGQLNYGQQKALYINLGGVKK